MFAKYIKFVLAVVFTLCNNRSLLCPVTDSCYCNEVDIICSNTTTVPMFYHDDQTYTTLQMSSLNLSEIPKNAFVNIRVRKLVLADNKLESLHEAALGGLEGVLEELSLASCNLKKIPFTFLEGQTRLQSLILWDNKLTEVSASLFKPATKLTHLYLWGNKITKLSPQSFGRMRHLKRLDLEYNRINLIKKETFKRLTHLEILQLAHNNINSISRYTFQGLKNLKILKLNNNGLQYVFPGSLDNLGHLQSLSLQHNMLNYIPAQTFKDLRNLIILQMHDNRVELLWPKSFEGMYQLQRLSLSENKLKTVPKSAFKSSKLKYLFLDNNNLVSLDKCVLAKKTKLNILSLLGNNISCGCPVSWMLDLEERGGSVWGLCNTAGGESRTIANPLNYGLAASCSLSNMEQNC